MSTCPTCSEEGTPGALFCGYCGTRLVAARKSDGSVDPLIGQTLNGTYLIQQRIGSGGMGHVYKALHTKLESPVAVKIVRRELLAHDAMARRFQREARAASRLHHPNVVGVTDFGQSQDGTLFMVMEYVTGRSLSRVIADEAPLAERRVVHVGAQILSALAAAHASDILHRDLKPENIMLEARRDDPDSVKVLDFGIAKLLAVGASASTLTQAGLVCGTPGYMSPEQLQGEDLDPRSDLFSVAVVLYEMLTQRLPFDAQTPMELLHRHLSEPIAPPSQRGGRPIAPVLEGLVMQALSSVRESRPRSAEEMREQLLASLVPPAEETAQRSPTEVLPRSDPDRPVAVPRRTTSRPEGPPPRTPPRSGPAVKPLTEERRTPGVERSRSGPGLRPTGLVVGPTPAGGASAFEPEVLKRIEERLALLLGPVAPRLVNKASQYASNLDELHQQLAGYIPSKEDRRRFLAESGAERTFATVERTRATPAAAAAPAVAWDPALLDRARRDLAVHLGPLARVIVRRVHPRAHSLRELYELLSREIPSEAEREAFRRQAPPEVGQE